jgi:hypothetical protein
MSLKQKLAELANDIRRTPDRAMAAHVMAWSSGLVWEISLPGVVAALSAGLAGGTIPRSSIAFTPRTRRTNPRSCSATTA